MNHDDGGAVKQRDGGEESSVVRSWLAVSEKEVRYG